MPALITPTVVQISTALPVLPKGYKAPAFSPLSPATTSKLVPAGAAFHDHARRILNQRSFEEDDKLQHAHHLANGGGAGDDEDDADEGLGDEKEDKALLQNDPKLWKQQDHYAVLGLQSLRYKATDEQIKKAHRRKVLRHHPDKKASGGGDANDDSFFKCIAKAMEVISNPQKRREFDSVDEAIDDDDVPEPSDTTADNFYALWAPVFEREGRFSVKQPVPSLGDKSTPKQEVESFYSFWYGIDSWRSFEYLDKEANEGTDSRDEKRHQEKKNKAERAAKKKADITRVRTLVDRALSLDPRIKQFKADEKAARDAKKKGGAAAVDPKKAEEDAAAAKAAEEAKAAETARADAEAKTDREAAKKAKAAAAKNVKKDRKAISAIVTSNNYFVPAGTPATLPVVEGSLGDLDVLFNGLEPEDTATLKAELEAEKDVQKMKTILTKWAATVEAGTFKIFRNQTRAVTLARQVYDENQTLRDKLLELETELSVWKGGLRDAVTARELSERKLKALESNENITFCILDGDGCIFNRSYLSRGREGGIEAASKLHRDIAELVGEETKILVTVFMNKFGLSKIINDVGIATPDVFSAFILGFNSAHPLFTLTDVGPSKEAADAKFRSMIGLYANLPSCKRILAGCSHDNGYASTLSSLETEGRKEKLSILKSYDQVGYEIKALNMNMVSFDGLFEPAKLVSPAFAAQLASKKPDIQTPKTIPGYKATKYATPSPSPKRSTEKKPSTIVVAKVYKDDTTDGDDFVPVVRRKAVQQPQGAKLDPKKALSKQSPPPCNLFYLSTGGCHRPTCTYSHEYALTPKHLETLRFDAQKSPCVEVLKGRVCKIVDCLAGHSCPHGSNCRYGQTCRFSLPNMHNEPSIYGRAGRSGDGADSEVEWESED